MIPSSLLLIVKFDLQLLAMALDSAALAIGDDEDDKERCESPCGECVGGA